MSENQSVNQETEPARPIIRSIPKKTQKKLQSVLAGLRDQYVPTLAAAEQRSDTELYDEAYFKDLPDEEQEPCGDVRGSTEFRCSACEMSENQSANKGSDRLESMECKCSGRESPFNIKENIEDLTQKELLEQLVRTNELQKKLALLLSKFFPPPLNPVLAKTLCDLIGREQIRKIRSELETEITKLESQSVFFRTLLPI